MSSAVTLTPYIFFQGNCQEAMEFYKSIFGGEINSASYDDIPSPDHIEELKGKLMHAALSGGDVQIFGSDTLQASAKSAKVSISLNGSDTEKLTNIFKALSAGAQVDHELKKESWGGIFGQLTDKFGVDWMVNISQA